MGKRLTFLIITALAAGPSQATEYGDIAIVRADEKGILFEYRPVNVRLELAGSSDSSSPNKPVQRLAIRNCARTVAAGGYDLPVRIVLVGIPTDARPEVMAFASGENEVAVSDAAKNGRAVDRENIGAMDNYALNEEKIGVENRVVPDRSFWIGNQRVLRLKIFPARYDLGAKAYRVVEKLQVEVRLNSLENFVSSSAPNVWEKVLRSGLLNYEQAKTFRGRAEASGKLAKTAAFNSPFGQSTNWIKVAFSENGIYRIDRNMLSAAGVPVSSIDPRTIRMFCQGGRALPVFNNVPRPGWRELAMEVTGEQDSIFDTGDQIRFYGWNVEGWDYDTLNGTFSFGKNNYTTSQTFWLSWGGTFGGSALRVTSQNVAPGAAPVVGSFPARFRLEQDRFLAADNGSEINDYYNWYGGKGSSQSYFFTLPDLVSGIDTIGVRHLSGGIISLRVNGRAASFIGFGSGLNLFQTDTLKTGLNRVDLTLATTGSGFNYFDFFEAHYNRTTVYSAPLMEFETPTASGAVKFQISGAPQNFVLWEITNRAVPFALTGAVRDGSGVLSFEVDASTKIIFALTSTTDFKQPTLSRQTPADLTAANTQGEFILIAPMAFRQALSSYASHRAAYSGVAVQQVDVEQIYNNFSGGLPDPIAIRDFLKFARENWSDPKPRFVLLAGDATYDFRNILGTGSANYVAPFIVDPAFEPSSFGPSTSDEGFLYFGNPGILDSADQFLDMVIARWPVKNVSELQVIADKIRNYEASPEYGAWRSRVTLVADDEFAGSSQTQGFHTTQAESISFQHLPQVFDQKKVYLFDYPFDGLRHKPEAEEAIVKAWNDGHLLIDYIGHGNPNVWAHERVFKREEDVPRLVNEAKLPLVYAASCNINTFIEPLADGMGEDLMKNPNGGAVAVIAAVRIVFSGPNTDLNNLVFDLLFGADSLSIGEGFYLAKLLRQYSSSEPNDRRYILFGDPAMHLSRPVSNIRLTPPDSLSALGVAVVSGAVIDTAGDTLNGFNGTVTLTVFDGLRFKSHPLAGAPEFRVDYKLPGNMIYRGEAPVIAGQFQFRFVVPKDISYGDSTGRISAYAWNSSGDAAGYADSVKLSGSAVATNDTVGPKITLAASGGAALQPGEPVSAGVSLSVILEDSSGINITGDPAHPITADFDFPSGPGLDLTETFRYEAGSFSRGEAVVSVPELSAGRHTARIKAWDGANNSSVLEMPFEAVAADKLKLSGVLNYPNPMKDKTNFCYTLSAPADEVVIEIFSLAGRAVRTIRSTSTRPGYNFDTMWDGRDNDGDRVALGVYIYKIRARQASKETEEFGKLVVMR